MPAPIKLVADAALGSIIIMAEAVETVEAVGSLARLGSSTMSNAMSSGEARCSGFNCSARGGAERAWHGLYDKPDRLRCPTYLGTIVSNGLEQSGSLSFGRAQLMLQCYHFLPRPGVCKVQMRCKRGHNVY